MIYGYLCEDTEQELFIEHVLQGFVNSSMVKCKSFEKQTDFCDTIKPPSSNRAFVRKNFAPAAKTGFAQYGLDIFIAVFDFDDLPLSAFEHTYGELHKKYDHKIKKKSMLAIPVRSIEYWLWYLKHQPENPQKNQLENNPEFNRKKAKEDIFSITLPDGRNIIASKDLREEKTLEILNTANYQWLTTVSGSFHHFYEQVKEFCRIY